MVRFAIKFCNWDSERMKMLITDVEYTGNLEDAWKEILDRMMKHNDNCDNQIVSIELLEFGYYI